MKQFTLNRFGLFVVFLLIFDLSCKKKVEEIKEVCAEINLAEVRGCKLYVIKYLSCDSIPGGETHSGVKAFTIKDNFYANAPGYSLPKIGYSQPITYDACKNYISSMEEHWVDTWNRQGISWRNEYDYSNHKLWRIRTYDNGSTPETFILEGTQEITYKTNYCILINYDKDGKVTFTDTAFFNTSGDVFKYVRHSATFFAIDYYIIDTNTLNPYEMVPIYENCLPRSKHISLCTYRDVNGKIVLFDSLYEYTKTPSGYLKTELRYGIGGNGKTWKFKNEYEYKDCN